MSYTEKLWETLAFPMDEKLTEQELDTFLGKTIKDMSLSNCKITDIEKMFETANYRDFLKTYPCCSDWKMIIMNSVSFLKTARESIIN